MINSGTTPLSRPERSSSFSMVACPDEKQWVLEQAPPPVQERIMASWNEDFLEDFLSSFMGEQSIPVSPKLPGGYKALEEVSKSPESFGEIETNSIEKGNTAGGQTERKRKRRRFYDTKDENGNWLIPHVPLPRIPKSDIRREYAQLFTNVYNSGDNDLLRRFVGQMFPDSHSFRFGYGGTPQQNRMILPAFLLNKVCCCTGKYYELCTGRPMLYQFSREHMSMAPDVVFSFEAARIKLRSDGTAALYGRFTITGNQVFRCPYEEKLALDDHQMSPSFRLIGNHIKYTGSDIPASFADFPTSTNNEDTSSPTAPSGSVSITTESSSTDTTQEKDFLFSDPTTLLTVPFSSPTFIDQPLPPMPVVSTISVGPHVVDVLPEDFILYPEPKVVDFELNGDFCMSLDAQALIDGMELIVTANLLNKEPVETHASRLSS